MHCGEMRTFPSRDPVHHNRVQDTWKHQNGFYYEDFLQFLCSPELTGSDLESIYAIFLRLNVLDDKLDELQVHGWMNKCLMCGLQISS